MAWQVYMLDAEIQLLMPTGNNELGNAPLSYYRQTIILQAAATTD